MLTNMNFNENQNLLKFYNNRNLDINNQFFPNNDFLHQAKIPSLISLINNSTKEIFVENDNNYINQNNLFLNNVNRNIYNINHMSNMNNINNINKNFVKNRIEPNRLDDNLNLNDFALNKFLSNDLNFYSNNNVFLNNNYKNDELYPNLDNNKYNNFFDIDDINNINTQMKLINFAKTYNNNLNKDVNNINNVNIQKYSLTSLLCNKKGINEIKNIIRNNPNKHDLIRKIILTLNKENGLHIVFKNIYGNYFIQDLFEKMSEDLIQLTFELISSEFVNIAKSPSGTHCLQNLLNYMNNSEIEIIVIKSIKYKEKEMAFDNNATYVLQKIISNIPDKKRTRLNNIIIENLREFSLNANSVLVLEKLISTNTIEENKKKIINIIKKHFLVIAQNPFGNYVIQYLFEVWSLKDCQPIANEIINKVIDLSIERFSANIIMKSLKLFNKEYKKKLLYTLCFSSNIVNLLKNKYSYYVINKAIYFMDKDTKDKFKILLTQIMNNASLPKEKILINEIIILLNQ